MTYHDHGQCTLSYSNIFCIHGVLRSIDRVTLFYSNSVLWRITVIASVLCCIPIYSVWRTTFQRQGALPNSNTVCHRSEEEYWAVVGFPPLRESCSKESGHVVVMNLSTIALCGFLEYVFAAGTQFRLSAKSEVLLWLPRQWPSLDYDNLSIY